MWLLFSQYSYSKEDQFYLDVMSTFKTQIQPRIIQELPSGEQKALQKINLVVVKNRFAAILAETSSDGDIRISTGFLDGLYNNVVCNFLEQKYQKSKEICDEYFQYYFKTVTSPSASPPIEVSERFLKKYPEAMKEWQDDKETQQAITKMYFAALINVIVHEYGHHIKGFTSSRNTITAAKKIEQKADVWSFNALAASGNEPIAGAVFSLGYISQIEMFRKRLRDANVDNPEFRQLPNMHPTPKVRVKIAYDHFCGGAAQDAKTSSSCTFIAGKIGAFY
jgi:hypothetical protein